MENIRIAAVTALPGHRLEILWLGGETSIVSVADFVESHRAFAPIRQDSSLFDRPTNGDWGGCVHWSDDMEIAAFTLWQGAWAKAA